MLRIVEFKTEYRAGKDPVDWVLIAPMGADFQRTQTWHRIKDIRPPENLDERKANSDGFIAMKMRWDTVGPAYEAWKAGNEIPVDGTPLVAWSGVSSAQAKFLKGMSIVTVEDVAAMNEQAVAQCRWPNARQLPELAAEYLKGVGVAEKDAEIAEMRERMAAMEALLEETTKPKRGPGRPKKAEAA